jgi:hypothetical protein
MNSFNLGRPKPIKRSWQAALLIGCLIVLGVTPGAAALAQDASSRPSARHVSAELEGLRFVGPFGAEGEKNPKQDAFMFKDGKFATASCLEWGFVPAPFWVRRGAKGLHFLAELKSPDHGTMRYEGVFDGTKLTVVGYWKKERWYWTIERTYRGEGRLPKPASK